MVANKGHLYNVYRKRGLQLIYIAQIYTIQLPKFKFISIYVYIFLLKLIRNFNFFSDKNLFQLFVVSSLDMLTTIGFLKQYE